LIDPVILLKDNIIVDAIELVYFLYNLNPSMSYSTYMVI
jgi:hypothetical protein